MLLTFGKKKFDVILCLDGDLPEPSILRNLCTVEIVAADGAGLKLIDMKIKPNVIIGDLDTFYQRPMSNSIEDIVFIQIADQETNDFEKALKYIINYGFGNVLIVGFHGGELEHTLNNWSILKKYSDNLNLCVYDKGRYAIPVKHSFKMHCKKNEIISIVPQPFALLETNGLKWELNNEILELGYREGIRNIAKQEIIEIKINKGEILLFIDARLPFAPNWINE